VAECLELLVLAEQGSQGSLVDRLRRLLGLKSGEPQRARA
jgi:hypothetical protein